MHHVQQVPDSPRAPACSVNVRICPIEAVESEGFGGGAVVAAAFGDVQVAASLMAAMMAARMVARLAGLLPVRLVAVSSLNVTSRTWWCASMDQGGGPGGPGPARWRARWSGW